MVKPPVCVFQIADFDLLEQLYLESYQVRKLLVCLSGMHLFLAKVFRIEASLYIEKAMRVEVEVGVENSQLLSSVNSIQDFQHVKAYQLIITIYYHSHFIPITTVHNGHVDILQSLLVFSVGHQLAFLLRNIIKIQIFFYDSWSVVCRSIINHHYFVIRVILRENGVEIELSPKAVTVIIGRHYDAKAHLLGNIIKFELFIETWVVAQNVFLPRPAFHS